jgi:hypothetical protein
VVTGLSLLRRLAAAAAPGRPGRGLLLAVAPGFLAQAAQLAACLVELSRRHVRPPRRLCALGRRVTVAVKSRAAVPRRTAAECPSNRRASCAVRSAAALNGWGGTRGWPQPKALIRCTAPCGGKPERCHDETMRSSALWVVHSADKPCRTSRLHILRAPDDFKYSRKQHPPCTDRVLTLTRRRPGKLRHSAHDPVPQRSHLGRRSGWRRIAVSL